MFFQGVFLLSIFAESGFLDEGRVICVLSSLVLLTCVCFNIIRVDVLSHFVYTKYNKALHVFLQKQTHLDQSCGVSSEAHT